MVIILQGTGWWVESFQTARANVNDQADRVTANTLERPGICIAYSATLDHTISVANTTGLSVVVRNIDNTQLTLGSFISSFETVAFNDSGSNANLGDTTLIFMRTRG